MSDDFGTIAFLEEARELLASLEEDLLEFEANPGDTVCVAKIFRTMHTIKGSGAMFGFEEIARFTHEVETTFDLIRNGKLDPDKEILTLTLQAKDHLHKLLSADPQGDAESCAVSDELIARFRGITGAAPQAAEPEKPQAVPASGGAHELDPEKAATYWIRYQPDSQTLQFGQHPLSLLGELAELGTMREQFYAGSLPNLHELDPTTAYCWWDILLVTDMGPEAIHNVFIFVEDNDTVVVVKLADKAVRSSDLNDLAGRFSRIADSSRESVELELKSRMNELLRARASAGRSASGSADEVIKKHEAPASSSIRVDSDRLDMLVNMVGELVIIQSRLWQTSKNLRNPALNQISEDLERLTDEMRDNALSLRMLPIGTTYGAFKRLVRDLSASLQKETGLITLGGDTELDKTVIDKLRDPLMHILRNSIDHGIEPAEIRRERNKPVRGSITISAAHSSGDVLISISDDGGGIDPDTIFEKAKERGLISGTEELGKAETLALLFEPGFSTAEKITDVSGRGVGMDVVKKSIDALRGSVEIDSEPGHGTTISIRLPLTLAIIDGLKVIVGKESFIVPLTTVEACQERFLRGREVKPLELIERRDKMIPCISIRKMLDVPGTQPAYERVLISGIDGNYVGLAVDHVVGRQQAVIKSLDQYCREVDWISGTTINGDGGISLILDVPQLVRYAVSCEDKLAQ